MAYCQNCGAQLSDSANFCPSCGASVNGTAQATNTQTTNTQADAAKVVGTVAGVAVGASLLSRLFRPRPPYHHPPMGPYHGPRGPRGPMGGPHGGPHGGRGPGSPGGRR